VPAVKLSAFGGMVPVQDARLLPDNFAVLSKNSWLYGGSLEGYRYPTKVRDLNDAAARTVYRIPTGAAAQLSDPSIWMEFTDPDLDVVRAPVVGDEFRRFYWAGSVTPPSYNTYDRIAANDAAFTLGIPVPATAPGVVPDASGVGTTEARAYVYTWVSAYGEEGPPSPPTLVSGKIDDVWAITVTAPLAGDFAGRNLSAVRIYRTITGTAGSTSFFLVTEEPIATTAYNDTSAANDISGETQLESFAYTAPPTTLKGIVMMPNGIIAGWTGQDVWFCEPYRPHAWPAAYTITVEHPIVGMGAVGSTLVVCTTGKPWAITGTAPSSMIPTKVELSEPCLTRGSIVATPAGVYYASPNGIVQVVPTGSAVVTSQLIRKQDWMTDGDPTNLRCVRYKTALLAFRCPPSASMRGFLIDPIDTRVAYNEIAPVPGVTGLKEEFFSGETIVLAGGAVWQWDAAASTNMMPYVWVSKEFEFPKPHNFAAFQVWFDDRVLPSLTSNAWVDAMEPLVPSGEKVHVRAWADGELIYDDEYLTSGRTQRLPSGFKGTVWKFEIAGRVRVRSAAFATSARELKNV
jgi:hypothetical protein